MREFVTGGVLVFQFAYSLILYLALAISLYEIAKNNHLSHSWIAFLPILQVYIIGALCEEYMLMGRRIRHLEWVMVLLHLLRIYLRFFSGFFFAPVRLVINVFLALFLHKFFYLFVPNRATLYAVLALLGEIPLVVLLFFIKDKPLQMSAGAYPYPFGNRY